MFDLETVATLGVNVRHLRTFNFAIGCLLAGLSGVLAAGQIGLNPNMGDELLMPSFIAIIVAGVGSLIGTLLSGLLIGMAAALTTVVYPAASEAVISSSCCRTTIVDDGELDVVRRRDLYSRRAVFPARPPWHATASRCRVNAFASVRQADVIFGKSGRRGF
jgi:hypothetical protein